MQRVVLIATIAYVGAVSFSIGGRTIILVEPKAHMMKRIATTSIKDALTIEL